MIFSKAAGGDHEQGGGFRLSLRPLRPLGAIFARGRHGSSHPSPKRTVNPDPFFHRWRLIIGGFSFIKATIPDLLTAASNSAAPRVLVVDAEPRHCKRRKLSVQGGTRPNEKGDSLTHGIKLRSAV